MATVQWKQLARNISGSGDFTGSLSISGSIQTSGSLTVDGTTVLRSNDTGSYSLSVEGQMRVVQREVQQAIRKAKLEIENLGSLGDKDEDNSLDLGGFF
jgi:hypothetical protein